MNSYQPITAADLAAATAPLEELSIISTLKSLREGEFLHELDDIMQQAINTASELGKPAKLTVTFDIVPAGRTVVLTDDIKPKMPQATKDATIFYLGKGNRLTRTDPKQATFPAEVGFVGQARADGNGVPV